MSEHKITVEGGTSVRLPTGGKYCDRDIVVTAEGTKLPALTNPAAEEDVLLNKDFIGKGGERRCGTLQPYAFTPGWEVMVPLRKTYDSSDVFLQMTSLSGFGDAAEEDVAAGKTFTNEQGVAKVGTHVCSGGGGSSVTRKVIFRYYTVDEWTPAWEIEYFLGNSSNLSRWAPDYADYLSFSVASDGEEVTLSSNEMLVIRCMGIGGASYYCLASGGFMGFQTNSQMMFLLANPDIDEDIVIESAYNP